MFKGTDSELSSDLLFEEGRSRLTTVPFKPFTSKGRQTFLIYYISALAWEPSVAQGTHKYSRRLPALRRFLLGNKLLL